MKRNIAASIRGNDAYAQELKRKYADSFWVREPEGYRIMRVYYWRYGTLHAVEMDENEACRREDNGEFSLTTEASLHATHRRLSIAIDLYVSTPDVIKGDGWERRPPKMPEHEFRAMLDKRKQIEDILGEIPK